MSVRRQCELLGLCRSGLYYEPAREPEADLKLMRMIDEQYLRTPFYGSRRMAAHLTARGEPVNRKRAQRLMRIMGLEAIYPRGPEKGRVAPGDCSPRAPTDPYVHFRAYGSSGHVLATGRHTEWIAIGGGSG